MKKIISVCTVSALLFTLGAHANALPSSGVHYLQPTKTGQSVTVSDSYGNIIISNTCPSSQIYNMSYQNTLTGFNGYATICPPLGYGGSSCDNQYGASNNALISYRRANPYVLLTISGTAYNNTQIPAGQDVSIPCYAVNSASHK